uniref:Uncharacterized protein n=1 Tax=Panagrolaimus sp. PS1159 TaxID=55785 RepID=A0AC35FII7_9BILA
MGNCESSTHDKQIHPAKDVVPLPVPPHNPYENGNGDSLQSPPPHISDSIKGGPTFSLEPSAFSISGGTNPSGLNNDWSNVKDALNRNRQIEEQIMKDHRKLEKVIKLLLLGPAESGKSTILKQIKIIHLHGFSMADLGEKKPLIFRNIYESIIQLIKGAHSLGFELPANLQTDIDTFCLFFNDYQFGDQMEFPKTMYPVVKRIWANERIKEVYAQRSDVYVMDCAK